MNDLELLEFTKYAWPKGSKLEKRPRKGFLRGRVSVSIIHEFRVKAGNVKGHGNKNSDVAFVIVPLRDEKTTS